MAEGAHWKHTGDPAQPHMISTTGFHTDEGIKCAHLSDETMRLAGIAIAEKLARVDPNIISRTDRVTGPPSGADRLAPAIAEGIGFLRGRPCLWAPLVRHGDHSLVFANRDQTVIRGEYVLVSDDVLSTGSSGDNAAIAVSCSGGYAWKRFVAIVNRSGRATLQGREVTSILDKCFSSFPEKTCPLCLIGSKAIRPGGENWARLKGNYGKEITG